MDIPFNKGFIAITGETGAGKSIMLGALGLIIGQRADSNVLWDKEKKCIRLHPENHTMEDIIVSNCEIQGVAVHVIKALE